MLGIFAFAICLLVARSVLHWSGQIQWAISIGAIGETLMFLVIGIRLFHLPCSGD